MTPALQILLFGSKRFDPTQLFKAGQVGWAYWYDDPALYPGGNHLYLFQDSAGTLPVTAVGQTLGMVKDRSGSGNHRIQATSTARPILRQDSNGNFYAEFDGTDDGMATASAVDASAYNSLTAVVGIHKSADAGLAGFFEMNSAAPPSFALYAPVSAAANYMFRTAGSGSLSSATATGYAAPISNVVTAQGNIAADVSTLRINGVAAASSSTDQGAGNYGNATVFFGARNGIASFFNGREYSNVMRFGGMTDTERDRLERWTAQRMGVSI